MPVVTRRMRLMEGAATLGDILTHDAMDIVMEHLSLTDCLQLRAISKEVGTPLGLGLRLDAELASFEREFLRREDERQRLDRDFNIHHHLLMAHNMHRLKVTAMVLRKEAQLAGEEVTLTRCRWKQVERRFCHFRMKLPLKHNSNVCARTMLRMPPPVIYLGA